MTDEILSFFQSLEKPKFRIPIFGKAIIQNSNVWKSQNLEFQCLENPKTRIPMFGKAKIQNSNVWKSQNQFYLKISSVNTRKDHNSIGAIGFKQVSMAVENASKTLVINMVSMIRKHITVDRV